MGGLERVSWGGWKIEEGYRRRYGDRGRARQEQLQRPVWLQKSERGRGTEGELETDRGRDGGLKRQGWSGNAEDRSRAKERDLTREDVRLKRQEREGGRQRDEGDRESEQERESKIRKKTG